MKIKVCLLGEITYEDALSLQERLLILRQQQLIDDLLLLLEHPAVITLGKRGKTDHILHSQAWFKEHDVAIVNVNRGGDVTYHGPGQIIGYPFIDLHNHGKDIRKFIHSIEQVFIELLAKYYDVVAYTDPKHPGVWTDQGKITAIGFAIKRWVTMHGFAFNVNTNLSHFDWIVPCGIFDRGVSSVQSLLNREIDMPAAYQQVITCFAEVFSYTPEIISRTELYDYIDSVAK